MTSRFALAACIAMFLGCSSAGGNPSAGNSNDNDGGVTGDAAPTEPQPDAESTEPVCPSIEDVSAGIEFPKLDWDQSIAESECPLHYLDTVIGDRRFICSGEEDHGVAETEWAHALLLRHLVLHKGLRRIAIESISAAVDLMDQFVATGDENALNQAFLDSPRSLGNLVEREKLIRFIRELSLQLPAGESLHVDGIDIAVAVKETRKALAAYLNKVEPTEAQKWSTDLSSGTAADMAVVAEKLVAQLESKREAYVAASSEEEWRKAKRNALNLQDGYNFLVYYQAGDFWTGDAKFRENGLIRNTLDLLNRYKDEKILLLAHDGHCAREYNIGENAGLQQDALGTAIAKSEWGKDYFVLAQLYAGGTELTSELKVARMRVAPSSLDIAIQKATKANQLLLVPGTTFVDLNKPWLVNNVGQNMIPLKQWDALLWIREVHAATLRK